MVPAVGPREGPVSAPAWPFVRPTLSEAKSDVECHMYVTGRMRFAK